MGRPLQGWKLVAPRERAGAYHVRFTHNGRRYDRTTGCTNSRAAQKKAKEIYARIIAGQDTRDAGPGSVSRPLDELMSEWLAAKELEIHSSTFSQYEMYVATYFLPFFETLEDITTASGASYVRERLKRVTRSTVTKELSALRGFLAWCEEQGHLPEPPRIRPPPRKATGTRAVVRRTVELTPEQVEELLAALPEASRRGAKPKSFYTLLWETGLRKATLERLDADDFRMAERVLVIRDEVDKARFGRTLPLSERAYAVLCQVTPSAGLIFGRHDMRTSLRNAGREAGLADIDVRYLSNHDFRHGRTTALLETSDNMVGVAFLVGHKQITTTNRYVKPRKRAAEAVLAASAQRSPLPEAGIGAGIGAEAQKQESPAEAGLTVSHRNDSVAEERTRTSTGVTPQEPESCASASSATSAGVSKEAVRYVVTGSLSSGIGGRSRGTPKTFHTPAPSAVQRAAAEEPSG